jgi:double zinc ribbon protein
LPNLTSLKPLLFIVVFYLLAFWLSLSYWAFRDARERSNSVLFHVFATGLSLVLPIFGLFIYMIIRPPLTMAERRALELETQALAEPGGPARELRPCPSCGEPIDSQYVLCPHCKTQFSKLCPRCNKQLKLGWSVCPYCAEEVPLQGSVPTPRIAR